MSVEIAKHWITVEEYDRMATAGVFAADARLELIEGEILEMSPVGKRHAACIGRLTEVLSKHMSGRAILWVQNPIRLNDLSVPQPDVALLRKRDDFYENELPKPYDVLLIVEVADSTVGYDREIKLKLYARAGIAEVWIANLPDAGIEIYIAPSGDAYRTAARVGRGARIVSPTVSGLTLEADTLLG